MHSTGLLSAFSQEDNQLILCYSTCRYLLDSLFVIITSIVCLAPFNNCQASLRCGIQHNAGGASACCLVARNDPSWA
jgi:hypothetical protein